MGALPVTEKPAAAPPEIILVVEDEVLIRLEVCDYLRECGFQVLEAATADEAVVVLESGISVDLVFSDVQMPGRLDGFGLARWVRTNRPDIRVVLTSGVARTAELAEDLCSVGPVIEKPFSQKTLINRIRELLASVGRQTG